MTYRSRWMRPAAAVIVLGAIVATLPAANAQQISTIAREAIMIDAQTGTVLLNKGADESTPPASMSKMMTVYMLFEKLKNGSLSMDDTFRVSEKAWRKGGSKMFVRVNTRVKIHDLLRGIIVQSGNDACIVVAEGLAGSEEAFAQQMTKRAHEIGLTHSTFHNATGWPDPKHRMTVRDIAHLALRTIHDFPKLYSIYSEKSFTYNKIKQGNRNPLLYRDIGADGLKTGHTEEAGYGLASSAVRNGRRLILVVTGLPSMKARGTESERLLDWGFREFSNYKLFSAGDQVDTANVWLGAEKTVPLVIGQDVLLTLPRKARAGMKVKVVYDGPLPAPIAKGTKVAQVVVEAPGREPMTFPLLAGKDVAQLGLFGRLGAAVRHVLWGAG